MPDPIRVVLVARDPAWSRGFSRHSQRIRDALGEAARRVEHIGSTAVPGLAAKPIIDILLVVDEPADEASFPSWRSPATSYGYANPTSTNT